ncbi:hypothetical protein [Pedobacter sp. NJ-S-72]
MRQKGVKLITVVLICLCTVLPASASYLNKSIYKDAPVSFSSLLTPSAFNKIFPLRNKFYTYASLLKKLFRI